MCGDWPRADIYARWPSHIADELSTFSWPITCESELLRLFSCKHATPEDIVGCEFTAAVREENERVHQVVTLSVDPRASLTPGVHACMDLRLVLPRKQFVRAYLFPSCTHQTLSDTGGKHFKEQDGRMFWGILFVIWCYTTACAAMILVEQPDTRVPDFFIQYTQRLSTAELGDTDRKTVCLYELGRSTIPISHPGAVGISGHGRLRDFADAERRDRWRSSWLRFPNLVKLVVAADMVPRVPGDCPPFPEARETFAVAWFLAGLPVPYDYETPDAQPLSAADRAYQMVRGPGHGRCVRSVTPRSLRADASFCMTLGHRLLDLREVTSSAIALCFVAMQAVPLVFASLNGFEVLGAELPAHGRGAALAVATRWAEQAISQASSTFLVGTYRTSLKLFAAPLNYSPPESDIVRTPLQRHVRQRAGVAFAWCTLAALAGAIAYDPSARAMAACSAIRGPVGVLADSALWGHAALSTFSVGVFSSSPLVDRPSPFPFEASTAERSLRHDWLGARALKDALNVLASSDEDLGFWAEKIQPPRLQDLPSHFLERLPTFDDARLDRLAFVPDFKPPKRDRLLIKPPQPPLPDGRCVRSIFDLMPDTSARRIRTWFRLMLEDLVCMRELGEDCDRHPPSTMVMGPSDLYGWAGVHVWDLRQCPEQCATALDYSAPITPTLNADFFARELKDYDDQRILGMLQTGVIYMADVEMQSVFIKHLISLPAGFQSVAKELRRLQAKGWYDFTPNVAFWPCYFNAQGSTIRKLEPERRRRTTEGGGPRRDTWDRSGLKVITLNEASKSFHVPRHYAQDDRPEFHEWMRSRHLPPTPDDLAFLEANHGSKWGLQRMPTVAHLQQNLAVLRRAAHVLSQPLYLFGNDVKDYFNHLENSPSELPLMNIIFLGAEGDLSEEARLRATADASGNFLIFVSERRMGFGIHPNSNIAQDLSEAIDHIFRTRMDAVEDPINEADPRPAMQNWLAARRQLEARVGGHQRRLYTTLTYCDDNVVGVVGVEPAIRAVRLRREIEREAGLIMAIPEKRMIGTWGLWLGILFFAQLGFLLVPKAKLLRASQAVSAALANRLAFDLYRSLIGLLEHIRHALRQPRRTMHGLYFPHGPSGEGRDGPSAIVRPNQFMSRQLLRWRHLLQGTAGSYFSDVITRRALPSAESICYYGSSDAATDSSPAGMGGYMHGFYWYLQLSADVVYWLHISVLELLATGFSVMTFPSHVPPTARLTLGADASATVTTLTRESESSDSLIVAHHQLLNTPAFQRGALRTDLGHLFGDANIASDLVSRAKWREFFALCNNVNVAASQVPLPAVCHSILESVLAAAKARGLPVRPNMYRAEAASVPPSLRSFVEPVPVRSRSPSPAAVCCRHRHLSAIEQSLGRRVPNTEEADAVDTDADASGVILLNWARVEVGLAVERHRNPNLLPPGDGRHVSTQLLAHPRRLVLDPSAEPTTDERRYLASAQHWRDANVGLRRPFPHPTRAHRFGSVAVYEPQDNCSEDEGDASASHLAVLHTVRAPPTGDAVFFVQAGWRESFPVWLTPWVLALSTRQSPPAGPPLPVVAHSAGHPSIPVISDSALLDGFTVVHLPLPSHSSAVAAALAFSMRVAFCGTCQCPLHPLFQHMEDCYYHLRDSERSDNQLPVWPSMVARGRDACHVCGRVLLLSGQPCAAHCRFCQGQTSAERCHGCCALCRNRHLSDVEQALGRLVPNTEHGDAVSPVVIRWERVVVSLLDMFGLLELRPPALLAPAARLRRVRQLHSIRQQVFRCTQLRLEGDIGLRQLRLLDRGRCMTAPVLEAQDNCSEDEVPCMGALAVEDSAAVPGQLCASAALEQDAAAQLRHPYPPRLRRVVRPTLARERRMQLSASRALRERDSDSPSSGASGPSSDNGVRQNSPLDAGLPGPSSAPPSPPCSDHDGLSFGIGHLKRTQQYSNAGGSRAQHCWFGGRISPGHARVPLDSSGNPRAMARFECVSDSFQIFVKGVDGVTMPLLVAPSTVASSVIEEYQLRAGMGLVARLRIVWHGKQLDGNVAVGSVGVVRGSTLHVLGALPGGMLASADDVVRLSVDSSGKRRQETQGYAVFVNVDLALLLGSAGAWLWRDVHDVLVLVAKGSGHARPKAKANREIAARVLCHRIARGVYDAVDDEDLRSSVRRCARSLHVELLRRDDSRRLGNKLYSTRSHRATAASLAALVARCESSLHAASPPLYLHQHHVASPQESGLGKERSDCVDGDGPPARGGRGGRGGRGSSSDQHASSVALAPAASHSRGRGGRGTGRGGRGGRGVLVAAVAPSSALPTDALDGALLHLPSTALSCCLLDMLVLDCVEVVISHITAYTATAFACTCKLSRSLLDAALPRSAIAHDTYYAYFGVLLRGHAAASALQRVFRGGASRTHTCSWLWQRFLRTRSYALAGHVPTLVGPRRFALMPGMPVIPMRACDGLHVLDELERRLALPRGSLCRTLLALVKLLTIGLPYRDYVALLGRLNAVRAVRQWPAFVMSGLYGPLFGDLPAVVRATPVISRRARIWIGLLPCCDFCARRVFTKVELHLGRSVPNTEDGDAVGLDALDLSCLSLVCSHLPGVAAGAFRATSRSWRAVFTDAFDPRSPANGAWLAWRDIRDDGCASASVIQAWLRGRRARRLYASMTWCRVMSFAQHRCSRWRCPGCACANVRRRLARLETYGQLPCGELVDVAVAICRLLRTGLMWFRYSSLLARLDRLSSVLDWPRLATYQLFTLRPWGINSRNFSPAAESWVQPCLLAAHECPRVRRAAHDSLRGLTTALTLLTCCSRCELRILSRLDRAQRAHMFWMHGHVYHLAPALPAANRHLTDIEQSLGRSVPNTEDGDAVDRRTAGDALSSSSLLGCSPLPLPVGGRGNRWGTAPTHVALRSSLSALQRDLEDRLSTWLWEADGFGGRGNMRERTFVLPGFSARFKPAVVMPCADHTQLPVDIQRHIEAVAQALLRRMPPREAVMVLGGWQLSVARPLVNRGKHWDNPLLGDCIVTLTVCGGGTVTLHHQDGSRTVGTVTPLTYYAIFGEDLKPAEHEVVAGPSGRVSVTLRFVDRSKARPVKQQRRKSSEESGLGKRRRDCVDGDGPGRYAAAAALEERHGALAPVALPSPAERASRSSATRKRQHGASVPVAAPSTIPVVVVGGQRFAAPAARAARPDSRRKQAMVAYAHQRAVALAAPGATAEQREQLQAAVLATQNLSEFGAAVGTLDKDDHAWLYWERFSAIYGWDPIIAPEYARRCPHEVSQRLAVFQAWVYPQLRGRKQADAKPRTVFNGYVLAVIRTLQREHVPMPKAKSVERSLAGIMRSFKVIYGHEALMPGRKQPFTPEMWARVEALLEGEALSGRCRWSPLTRHRDRNLLRLGRVLWRSGHRIGEIVWHPSGEISYLTRGCVSISKADGSKIARPTVADWHALAPGDSVLLSPCTSKSDQFGEQHCPFPSILPFDGCTTSAAAAVRDIELESPCLPSARRTTPLFSDENGAPFTYNQLHGDLRSLLAALYGKEFASAYSWHSFRRGLACALCAANAPDAMIQLICRWSSPDSLRVYRQMGIEKNVYWTNLAQKVVFDATLANNLPVLDSHDSMAEQVRAFAGDLEADALDGSEVPTPKRPPPALRSIRVYTIPGGRVQAHPSDSEGLVGLTVKVPASFWSAEDVRPGDPATFDCLVVAECAREFLHPDGTRCRSYLLEWHSQYFPIKREALLRVCLSTAQRAALRC